MVVAPTTISRQPGPIIARVIWAAAAEVFTWKSLGRVPNTRPRGAISASRRNDPPIDSPTCTTKIVREAPPTIASNPRRLIRGGRRVDRRKFAGLGRFLFVCPGGPHAEASERRGPGRRGAQLGA